MRGSGSLSTRLTGTSNQAMGNWGNWGQSKIIVMRNYFDSLAAYLTSTSQISSPGSCAKSRSCVTNASALISSKGNNWGQTQCCSLNNRRPIEPPIHRLTAFFGRKLLDPPLEVIGGVIGVRPQLSSTIECRPRLSATKGVGIQRRQITLVGMSRLE